MIKPIALLLKVLIVEPTSGSYSRSPSAPIALFQTIQALDTKLF